MNQPDISPAFERHFGLLLDLARWNESVGGHSAWFESSTVAPEQYLTRTWRLAEAGRTLGPERHRPEPGVPEPGWLALARYDSIRLRYAGHAMSDGDPVELPEYTTERYRRWEGGDFTWRSPDALARQASIGKICVRACNMARSFDELALGVRTYTDWATPDKPAGLRPDDRHIGFYAMGQSLLIANQAEVTYADGVPFMAVLAGLDSDNPHHQLVHRAAVDTLGRVLLEQEEVPEQVADGLPHAKIAEAILALESHQLLDERWWGGFCIVAGGVFKLPGLLPIVYEKLNGEGMAAMLATFNPRSAQADIRMYITRLLRAYAEDETRDQLTMAKIRDTLIDKRGAVNLAPLFIAANEIIRGKNAAITNPRDRLPEYSLRDIRGVGGALLEILDSARAAHTGATSEVQAAHFEQDVLHVEIIDTLHMLLRHARSEAIEISLHSVRMRYPDASDTEVRDIRDQLNQGRPPAVVRARYRGKQGPARGISVHRITDEGGLIS